MTVQQPRDMKIVNIEEWQINRKYTINIYVEKDGAVNAGEVMDAISQRGWLEVTKMLQQTSRNRFKWSVSTYTDATSILTQINEFNLKVSGYSTSCTYAARYRTYILYDTPYEISPQAVQDMLSPYGKVESLKRTVYRDYPTIFDGRVIVSFTELYTDQMPDIFQLRGAQILVREAGQPVRRIECTKCRTIGAHNTRDCLNETTCDRCGTQGHRRYQCPEVQQEKEDRIRRQEERQKEVERRNQEIDNSKDIDLSPEYVRHDEVNNGEGANANRNEKTDELLEMLATAGENEMKEMGDKQESFEEGQKFETSEEESQDRKLVIDEGKEDERIELAEGESVGDKLLREHVKLDETNSTEPEAFIDRSFVEHCMQGTISQTVTSTPIPREGEVEDKGRLWSERSSEVEEAMGSPKKVKLVPYPEKAKRPSQKENTMLSSLVKCAIDQIEKGQHMSLKPLDPSHPALEQRASSRGSSRESSRNRKKHQKDKDKDRRSESKRGR